MDILKKHELKHTVHYATFSSKKGFGETGGTFGLLFSIQIVRGCALPEKMFGSGTRICFIKI